MIKMNGLRTERAEHKAHGKVIGHTIFVALPMECWRPIQGGCGCPFCKAHPELIPHWDTLVVDAARTAKRRDHTTTCHYPEFTNPTGLPWTRKERKN